MTEQGPAHGELARLQRAAYSREATDADRRRLAAYEAAHAPGEAAPPEAVAPDEPVDAVASALDDFDDRPVRRGRAALLVGCGALAGALVVGGAAWGLRPSEPDATTTPTPTVTTTPDPATEPSFDVFLRAPEPYDFGEPEEIASAFGMIHPQTRLLAEIDGYWLYAATGGMLESTSPGNAGRTVVCLFTDDHAAHGHACISEGDFRDHSLALVVGDYSVVWGPVGVPQVATLR